MLRRQNCRPFLGARCDDLIHPPNRLKISSQVLRKKIGAQHNPAEKIIRSRCQAIPYSYQSARRFFDTIDFFLFNCSQQVSDLAQSLSSKEVDARSAPVFGCSDEGAQPLKAPATSNNLFHRL